jgi:hypothetical protein
MGGGVIINEISDIQRRNLLSRIEPPLFILGAGQPERITSMPTLEFKGKQFFYAHHLTVPFRPLVIDEKKSLAPKGVKPTLDGNLIIHGDNRPPIGVVHGYILIYANCTPDRRT